MNDNENLDDYRERAQRSLDEKIKQFTDMLGECKDKADEANVGDKNRRETTRMTADVSSGVHFGHRQRMRDSAGHDARLDSFSDVELLEYLLSFLIPRKDTNVMAHALLDSFGSVAGVMSAPEKALKAVPSMTAAAAKLIPLLKNVGKCAGRYAVAVKTRNDAANFFGALYASGSMRGTFVAYLDSSDVLLSVELVDMNSQTALRDMVGSAVNRGAAKAMLLRCVTELIDMPGYKLSRFLSDMSDVLGAVHVTFLDFIMFTDYGYYTLGELKRNYGGWTPQYLFVPEKLFARSPFALDKIHTELDREKSDDDEDMQTDVVSQLREFFDGIRKD